VHEEIQTSLEQFAQLAEKPQIKTGVEAYWEVRQNDDGVAVTLELVWEIYDYVCEISIRNKVFVTLNKSILPGYKVVIPEVMTQKTQKSNIFVIQLKPVEEEAEVQVKPLPTVPVKIMQSSPKRGLDKANTWANLLSSNGMENNELFKKLVVEAERADADDYQSHYAEMLTLKKIIEVTKTQETVSEELALWKSNLLEMGNLRTKVLSSGDNMEAVQLNLGDHRLNLFNIAFAPSTPEIQDPKVEVLSVNGLHDGFKNLAAELKIPEQKKDVFDSSPEVDDWVEKTAIQIWVHGITVGDKEFALNQEAVLQSVTLIYNFLRELARTNPQEAKSLFEQHIVENAMFCEDRSKVGLINLRSIRRIHSLDKSSKSYADNLIDLLLQEQKKFIFQTYMQEHVNGVAKDDESVETYLKRMTLFDNIFNLGFKSTMLYEGSANPGSYATIIDLFFHKNWMNFKSIFEESIFQNELVKDWCDQQNKSEFGIDEHNVYNAENFVTRDEKGMLKYCIFTKTDFVKKYLVSMNDDADAFHKKFVATAKIADDHAVAKADRVRKISEKRQEFAPDMAVCQEMINALGAIIAAETAPVTRNLLNSTNRRLRTGHKAWPAAIAKHANGGFGAPFSEQNTVYKEKKTSYKRIVSALQPAHFLDERIVEEPTAMEIRFAIQQYLSEMKKALQ